MTDKSNLIEMTADVITAYVIGNSVAVGEVPRVIRQVYQALKNVQTGSPTTNAEPLTPAVPIKNSVTPDYVICLEDGLKFKSMKRHLNNAYGLSPAQYREKWGLPDDYPMVAPNYSAARSKLAKETGLGRQDKKTAVKRGVPRNRK